MNTKMPHLLSAKPVAGDYLKILQDALDRAEFARFVVGYVSGRGIQAIGQTRLARALGHDHSFGVASLACATGFEPLIELQNEVGIKKPRIKYFLDPCVRKDRGEPVINLVHSKIAYIKLAGAEKAIILLGSHNWSGAALGGNAGASGRNAEASLYIELPFLEGHIDGSSDDLGGAVNSHMLSCWNLHSCLYATEANQLIFEQWMKLACESPGSEKLDEIVAILAIDSGGDKSPHSWIDLKGTSIYAQIRREHPDGELLWNKGSLGVVILVWGTKEELQRSAHPVLIFCHISTFNATQLSSVGSSNAAGSPVEGFASVLWEQTPVVDVRGMSVEHYELDREPITNKAAGIDGPHEPMYRFLLEVDEVVLPARMAEDARKIGLPCWEPGDLAFAESERVPPEKALGYLVGADQCRMIRQEFLHTFELDLKKLKVVPVDRRSPREGLRISKHALHRTFVSDEDVQRANALYSCRQIGDLVPEVNLERELTGKSRNVPRTSRVFMQSVETLKKKWAR
jgi:hypothetical protein